MAFVSLKSILKSQLPVGKVSKPKRIRVVAQIPAGNASVTPPLGPLLGQFGLNIMEFCKEFNKRSERFEKDFLLTTIIYIEPSKQYNFEINLPNFAYMLGIYFFDKIEYLKSKRSSIISLMKYIYDVILLYLSFYKVDWNRFFVKSMFIQILGTLRSFRLYCVMRHNILYFSH